MSVRTKGPEADRVKTKTFKRRRAHFVRPVDPVVEELRFMAVQQLNLLRTIATALETIATALVRTETGKGVQ
jgi:hypothetical protein